MSTKDLPEDIEFVDLDGQYQRPQKPLKCLDCLMAFETPAGLWCLKFKDFVNQKMADMCEDYIGPGYIPQLKSGSDERKTYRYSQDQAQ